MEYRNSYERIGGITDIDTISKQICKKYKFGKYIFEIKINNTSLKLFVMEFIAGKNYWELNRELNDSELKQVAKIAAKINLIDYDIKETFYDEWTVTNLKTEYMKKKHCLNSADNEMINQIVNDFESINFDQMKHTYIHGDIIKANLILDKKGKIYVIDFSAFNYLPRIIEISASLLGVCLTDDKKSTINKINNFLSYYNKYNTLENDEINNLPLILKALASMYIIQTCYIKSTSGDYLENDYWLSEGQKFLKMDIKNTDIQVN